MQNICVVDQAELERLIGREIDKLKTIIENSQKPKTDEWIRSCDVPAYLGVSSRTWQNYRDKRLIPYSQRGRVIVVRRSDLDKFLDSHSVKSKS